MTTRTFFYLGLSLLLLACSARGHEGAASDKPCAPVAEAPLADPPSPTPTATPTLASNAPATPASPSNATLTSNAAPAANGGADPDAAAPLSLKRLVVAHGVAKHEPVAPAAAFTRAEASRVYAFIELGNPDRADTEILVSFGKDGAPEGGSVHLRVGPSPRWRTWAVSRAVRSPGKWHVVVRNAAGKELGRARFEVTTAATTTKRVDGSAGDGIAPAEKPPAAPAAKASASKPNS